MLLSLDKTNFPLIAVEAASIETHLLPISKVQFEQFLADFGPGESAAYQEMLALNPAAAPAQFTLDERERLFVTGILPDEALAFARWLGEGFDLPTVKEWRAMHTALRRMSTPIRDELTTNMADGPAKTMLDKLERLHPNSMLDVSLMRHGLVEWVRKDKSFVGLGVPRPEFQGNLWDPMVNEVAPINLTARVPYFGFRLVRRSEWYLSDRETTWYVD
jgi:hypothetical protein